MQKNTILLACTLLFFFVVSVATTIQSKPYSPTGFTYPELLAFSQRPSVAGWPIQFVTEANTGWCSFCIVRNYSLIPLLLNMLIFAIPLFLLLYLTRKQKSSQVNGAMIVFLVLCMILLWLNIDYKYTFSLFEPSADWYYEVSSPQGNYL